MTFPHAAEATNIARLDAIDKGIAAVQRCQ